jgi:hypothetical protein
MKRVGASRGERFRGLAARARLGFRAGQFERRKVVDRAGPRELPLRLVRRAPRPYRKIRKGQDEEGDVPEGCRNNGSTGNAPVYIAIAKESAAAEILRRDCASHDDQEAAPKALAEPAPGNFELGPGACGEAGPEPGTVCLSQEIERLVVQFRRHGMFDYNPTPGAAPKWSKSSARIGLALTAEFLTG